MSTKRLDPISIWPENAVPHSLGNDTGDIPTITPYLPELPNGASVVVCPGGGYGMLADHEGEPVALWLNSIGVTAFVLRYRLGPRYGYPAISLDAARAIRTVRYQATEYGISSERIGILGFSAGGHLASTAATHSFEPLNESDPVEQVSARPNFAILIYPVITFEEPFLHLGSRTNLIGPEPEGELILRLSNHRQVNSMTPPTFLVHSCDDEPVPVENSLNFALALRAARVPFAIQVYSHGGHGFGLGGNDPVLSVWPGACAGFLRKQGFIP